MVKKPKLTGGEFEGMRRAVGFFREVRVVSEHQRQVKAG
jgi:hypothetical protein